MLYRNSIFYKQAFHRELDPIFYKQAFHRELSQPYKQAFHRELSQAAIQAFHRELSQAALFFPQGAVTTCTLFNVDRELSQAALFSMSSSIVQTVTGIKCLLYAYDLILWYSDPKKNAQERMESALNSALKLLANWCDNNRTVINTAKTACQTFTLARHSINPHIRGKDTTLEKPKCSLISK
ncbi:unnamed protein product [Rodentolepis nana]|uniref:Reverse transcriptase domain-containing protein n=1 Tax=Rodentolepis nana TaxID=102285 RepID=A0A0R3TEY5_RODNA|nr:unnamed protein product [Rodentolepis nana]